MIINNLAFLAFSIDFTASWCMPCRKMEKETWGTAEVRAWLAANAIAIQVDVDKNQDLVRRFRIETVPTVVALQSGVEFDRTVGYMDTASFLAWGRDIRAGKRASDGLVERSKALLDSQDVNARYDLVQELARRGLHDEALAHYLWLWPATRSVPAFSGVRVSFMLRDMAELARKHEPSRKAFDQIFAGLQAQIDAAAIPTYQDWQEWTGFCEYFGGSSHIIVWYEKHRDEKGRLLVGQQDFLGGLIVAKVFDILIEQDRPLDAVRLYDNIRQRAIDIVDEYRQRSSLSSSILEMRHQTEEYLERKLIEDLSTLYAALQAAERAEEGATVAAILLQTHDTPESRIGLVGRSLDMSMNSGPDLALWLDEAEAAGGNVKPLRRRLDSLRNRPDQPRKQ